MREFHNENTLYELVYCCSCKYKWTVEESKKINDKWKKTGKYKRFHTLDDAKKYALDKLKNCPDVTSTEREVDNMTQKEIMTAKRKAKECLEVFNMNVPMTKMCVLFYYFDTNGGFYITFIDVRTHDYFACDCVNNEYSLTIEKDTGKTLIFTESKGGETND